MKESFQHGFDNKFLNLLHTCEEKSDHWHWAWIVALEDITGPGKGRKPLVKKRRLESLGLRDSVSSQGQKSAQGMSTSTTEHNVSTSVSPFHLRDENDEETPLAGDSDIPLTPMSACSAKSSTFGKRGPTRNLSGRKNDDDAPHKVKLDDCYKRVVGPDSQSFINESSAVARKFGKHNVPKWSQLEKEDREAMCQRVMAKFPDDVMDAKMKKAVEQQVNKHTEIADISIVGSSKHLNQRRKH